MAHPPFEFHSLTAGMQAFGAERRLVFRAGGSSAVPSGAPASQPQSTVDNTLAEIDDHVASLVSAPSEGREQAVQAIYERTRELLDRQHLELDAGRRERLKGLLAHGRAVLEVHDSDFGNEEDDGRKRLETLASLSREIDEIEVSGGGGAATVEQEDTALLSDPAKWFKEKSAEVMQIFKKAASPAEWLKGIAAIAAMIGVGLEKLKDYVASAIGPTIVSLKEVPLVGGMFTGIEKFIGTTRKALFAALSGAGIELPLAVASYARKELDRIEKELSAAAKGKNAEWLAGRFVVLLKDAQVVGEAAKNATREKIDGVIAQLRGEVDATQKPEVAKAAALDDFGLSGWKEGEAREIGDNGIEFKDKGASGNAYVIKKDTIKLDDITYEVEVKKGSTNDVIVFFEPRVDQTTLKRGSKVIYRHVVGSTTEEVSVALSEIGSLVENPKSRTSGSLEVRFTKRA